MTIHKLSFYSIVLLVTVSLVHPLDAQESRPTKAPRHPLWKIESGHATVYLLGSVHLLKKEDYPLAAPIETAFSNAQIAVFEADMDEMHEPAAQKKMVSKTRLPPGETLQKHLSAATYADFTNHLTKA